VFAGIVTAAFCQRRKTLRNSLKSWFDASELAALGIDPTERPERLAIGEFERLAEAHVKKTTG
jgi:16S rRNA (adenine1518-N6/adenine1519-N6)-dimethyltransferase